jgi:hypothetical protein
MKETLPRNRAGRGIGRERFQKMLDSGDREWQGILRFVRYCGLDLQASARLRHSDFSNDYDTLRLNRPKKRGYARMILGPKLIAYLRLLPKVPKAGEPIFPNSATMSRKELMIRFREMQQRLHDNLTRRPFCFSELWFDFGSFPKRGLQTEQPDCDDSITQQYNNA